MATRKTSSEKTSRAKTSQATDELTAAEPSEVDLGYGAPPQEWPPDDRPPEQIAGTPEHLGTDDPLVWGTTPPNPYAGPDTTRDAAPPKP
jgi:hypothetical protein